MKTYRLSGILILMILTLSVLAQSQSQSYIPGPANLDTSKFAHVYFLRDTLDAFPDNWIGVYMKDETGLCVKTKTNSIYRVNTFLTGKTSFKTIISGVTEEVMIDIQSGRSYFIQMRPKKTGSEGVDVNMKVLSDSVGQSRIMTFPGTIQNRYCILPFPGNNDFRENVYQDTIRWYARKDYYYHFLPLPSWEIILRSSLLTVFGFRNKLISATYSETGGIRYLKNKRFKTEEDFEQYCKSEVLNSILDEQKDSLVSVHISPTELPEGIKYARLIKAEYRSFADDINNHYTPLKIHAAFIVFCWIDDKKKLNTDCLYISERGNSEELHSLGELEKRLLWSWQSLRLAKTDHH